MGGWEGWWWQRRLRSRRAGAAPCRRTPGRWRWSACPSRCCEPSSPRRRSPARMEGGTVRDLPVGLGVAGVRPALLPSGSRSPAGAWGWLGPCRCRPLWCNLTAGRWCCQTGPVWSCGARGCGWGDTAHPPTGTGQCQWWSPGACGVEDSIPWLAPVIPGGVPMGLFLHISQREISPHHANPGMGGATLESGGRDGDPHLEGLVEVLHHGDPLPSLLGKLGRLHLQRLHLVVQLPLVDVRLCHPAGGDTHDMGWGGHTHTGCGVPPTWPWGGGSPQEGGAGGWGGKPKHWGAIGGG